MSHRFREVIVGTVGQPVGGSGEPSLNTGFESASAGPATGRGLHAVESVCLNPAPCRVLVSVPPGEPLSPDEVIVVPFAPQYAAAFKALNEEWINRHFTLEAADRKFLDAPEANIIAVGGHILVALSGDDVVGVCALVKISDEAFELAKMAVAPRVQGRGIGYQLGMAAIACAKREGARHLYLESNTKLNRAIALYRRLGFTESGARPSPYTRCNIHMTLVLR